jgi:hypothetical protein
MFSSDDIAAMHSTLRASFLEMEQVRFFNLAAAISSRHSGFFILNETFCSEAGQKRLHYN